jgi:hypothetical protein
MDDELRRRVELEIGDVVLSGPAALDLLPPDVAAKKPAGIKVVVPDPETEEPVLVYLADHMEGDQDHLLSFLYRRREQLEEEGNRELNQAARKEEFDLSGRDRSDAGFGVCPVCKGQDGYLNVERDHWFKCDEHKVRWHVGSNLFTSWHGEDEEIWEKNARILSEYEEVEPVHTD